MVSEAALGRAVLSGAAAAFIVLVCWLNGHPFLDKDSIISQYTPHPQWALLFCAGAGLLFVGGLMSFTLYHIYPHL